MRAISTLALTASLAYLSSVALPPAALAGTLKDKKCVQRSGVCKKVVAGDCETSTSDCGNKTCPGSCPGQTHLVCVAMQGQTCNSDFTNFCSPDQDVPTCKGGERGQPSCMCDEDDPAGMIECPVVNGCDL
jgi:hypothetical protein